MAWIYLDDQFPDHPKIVEAGGDAAWLFVCGLAYCRRHGTDGRIPKAMVARLSDRKTPDRLAARLVAVTLWEDHGDHYRVHDYSDWNRTQESRSEAGRKAARARWDKKPPDAKRNANAYADAMPTHPERNATASESHMPQDALSLSLSPSGYIPTAGSRAWDPASAVDNNASEDRGSLLWATRLARQLGGHVALTADQVRTELLAAHADDPTLADDELLAHLAARRPA